MKAQILKIAGVKSEKEFYKKFPTEEAFMKKHGKQLQKAALGLELTPKSVSVQSPTAAMNQSIAQGSYMSKTESDANKKDNQYNKLLKQGLTALPGIVGGFQTLSEEQDRLSSC